MILKFIGKFFYGITIGDNNSSEELTVDANIEEEKLFWAELESSRVAPKYGINRN